jgi:hypothetical protein
VLPTLLLLTALAGIFQEPLWQYSYWNTRGHSSHSQHHAGDQHDDHHDQLEHQEKTTTEITGQLWTQLQLPGLKLKLDDMNKHLQLPQFPSFDIRLDMRSLGFQSQAVFALVLVEHDHDHESYENKDMDNMDSQTQDDDENQNQYQRHLDDSTASASESESAAFDAEDDMETPLTQTETYVLASMSISESPIEAPTTMPVTLTLERDDADADADADEQEQEHNDDDQTTPFRHPFRASKAVRPALERERRQRERREQEAHASYKQEQQSLIMQNQEQKQKQKQQKEQEQQEESTLSAAEHLLEALQGHFGMKQLHLAATEQCRRRNDIRQKQQQPGDTDIQEEQEQCEAAAVAIYDKEADYALTATGFLVQADTLQDAAAMADTLNNNAAHASNHQTYPGLARAGVVYAVRIHPDSCDARYVQYEQAVSNNDAATNNMDVAVAGIAADIDAADIDGSGKNNKGPRIVKFARRLFQQYVRQPPQHQQQLQEQQRQELQLQRQQEQQIQQRRENKQRRARAVIQTTTVLRSPSVWLAAAWTLVPASDRFQCVIRTESSVRVRPQQQ